MQWDICSTISFKIAHFTYEKMMGFYFSRKALVYNMMQLLPNADILIPPGRRQK